MGMIVIPTSLILVGVQCINGSEGRAPAAEKGHVSLATPVAAAGTSVACAEFPEYLVDRACSGAEAWRGQATDGPRIILGRK